LIDVGDEDSDDDLFNEAVDANTGVNAAGSDDVEMS
jgi:hypothetical protein